MTYFDNAIKVIFKHEGGYVNDPNDPGGATNFGISNRYFKNKYHELKLPQDVKNLTKEQASLIYEKYYWTEYPYDSILSEAIAIKLFDVAINMGKVAMINLFHQSLIKMKDIPMYVSNLQDLHTANVLIQDGKENILMDLLCKGQATMYETLVQKKPKLNKFLQGWLNRAKYRGTEIG